MNHSDETREKVDLHHRAIYGDPHDMKEAPGLIADISLIRFEQGRTNEILTEVRDSLARINWILVSAFILALIGVVFKNFTPPK